MPMPPPKLTKEMVMPNLSWTSLIKLNIMIAVSTKYGSCSSLEAIMVCRPNFSQPLSRMVVKASKICSWVSPYLASVGLPMIALPLRRLPGL